jgi:hypothetical protein
MKHGMTHTKFYRVWANLKRRCRDINNPNYPKYGGRGVDYCNRWKDFRNFRDDMYESYLISKKENGAQRGGVTIELILIYRSKLWDNWSRSCLLLNE